MSLLAALACTAEPHGPRHPHDPSSTDPAPATDGGLPLLDGFDGDSLDRSIWRIAERQWGGPDSGGVRPDNVSVRDGALVLTAHGDEWTGGPVGLDTHEQDRADGRRVGAAIATEAYLGSGRFEVTMAVAPELGVSSAIWTFFYQELVPYDVVNHEIDIELPGRSGPYTDDIGFDRVLDTSWVGYDPAEYDTSFVALGAAQDDGAWHTYVVDWHTGSDTERPRVEWSVDGVRTAVHEDIVPTYAGRLWLGAWFPDGWAGEPAFAEAEMRVDEVRYLAYHEPGDVFGEESYPDDGWAP